MLIKVNDFEIKLEYIKYDEESNTIYYFKNKNINAQFNDFKKFLKQSLITKISFNSENEYWDFIGENFDYMDMAFNPLNRKLTCLKLTNIIVNNDWIRNNLYLKNKLNKHKTRDKFYNFLFIIINCINYTQKNSHKFTKDNNIYFSLIDFIYDQY
tara:strand:- start:381 stop:845 length:465 start_codon:yes stop_codon:yes gene_type:complete